MENHVFFLVLFATIMHAVWNGMVKNHPDKAVAVAAIVFGHIPIAIIAIIFLPVPTKDCIPFIIASAIIHQGYQWYLLSAYQIGDLTKVYPIARGFGPLVATIISILTLGVVLKTVFTSIILFLKGLLFMSKFKLYFEISFSNITKVSALGISKEISFINFDIIL